MGGLLWSVGLLLRETGLSFRHIVVVLVLFASSRVFASLLLWITLGTLILAYTFMVLTALFYLRWIKRDCGHLLALTFGFAALAGIHARRGLYFAGGPSTVVVALLASQVRLSTSNCGCARRCRDCGTSIYFASGLHTGRTAAGVADRQLGRPSANLAGLPLGMDARRVHLRRIMTACTILCGPGFLFFLAAVFIRFSDKRRLELVFGICVLGLVLCTPALVIARLFGIALPSLAFFTAISIASPTFRTVSPRGVMARRFGGPQFLLFV